MLSYLLIAIYCLLFTFITWRKFHFALALLFLLLPTYLIRFNLGTLPTTLLEVMLGIIALIWLIRYHRSIIFNLKSSVLNHKLLFISITLFLLSATISIFTSVNLRAALGEWKAFYIEPVLLFIIFITIPKQETKDKLQKDYKIERLKDYNHQSFNLIIFQSSLTNTIIFALILSGLVTSLLAIYQHFTGYLVPYSFWQNQNTFRVTAWYGFPNAVGLFLAPLVPLAIYGVKQIFTEFKNKNWKKYLFLIPYPLFLILSPLAIFYAKSTGALVGLVAGIGFLLLFYKKTRWLTLAVGLVGLVSIASFSGLSNIKSEIFLQDRSGQIRIGIWQETVKFLSDHPIAGAGLASYQEKVKPYHTTVNGEGIEIFHHPHNIFLTMYVNLGLLGLISFILILISFFKIGLSHNTYHVSHNSITIRQCNNVSIYLISSMVIVLVMGLVDSPYIKNDLAIMFWLLPALLITSTTQALKPDANK